MTTEERTLEGKTVAIRGGDPALKRKLWLLFLDQDATVTVCASGDTDKYFDGADIGVEVR